MYFWITVWLWVFILDKISFNWSIHDIPRPLDKPLGFTIQIFLSPLKAYWGKLFWSFSRIGAISGIKSDTSSVWGRRGGRWLLDVLFKNVSSFHFCSISSFVNTLGGSVDFNNFFSSSNFFLASNSCSYFNLSSSFSWIILSNFSFSIILSFSFWIKSAFISSINFLSSSFCI